MQSTRERPYIPPSLCLSLPEAMWEAFKHAAGAVLPVVAELAIEDGCQLTLQNPAWSPWKYSMCNARLFIP